MPLLTLTDSSTANELRLSKSSSDIRCLWRSRMGAVGREGVWLSLGVPNSKECGSEEGNPEMVTWVWQNGHCSTSGVELLYLITLVFCSFIRNIWYTIQI